jgi:predicted DNA-binding transcriptional regulator AlpA
MNPTRKLLRKRQARERLAIGDTLFDTLVREGVLPRPIYLTASRRLPLWDSEEIDAFVRTKLDARSEGEVNSQSASHRQQSAPRPTANTSGTRRLHP